jgi:hypothetical protein
MNKEEESEERAGEPDVQQDTLWGRKFSLTEAIARLAGGGLLKGDSPVPGMRQAEFKVEQYLEQNLIDSAGALETVLLRRVRDSELFLKRGHERPLTTLAVMIEHLLSSDQLLRDFVTEVDREWGRVYRQKPRLEKPGTDPEDDDPYTISSVRRTLTNLLDNLRSR